MRIRSHLKVLIALITGFGVMGFIGSASADNDNDNGNRPSAREEIKELMSCYAYSFDTLARATDAVADTDFGSEANIYVSDLYKEALQRFRSCTTEDFVIEIYALNGDPRLVEGQIPAGPLAWVNLVNYFNRIGGTVNSQHLYGSFETTVDGKSGTLKAYAAITGYTASDDGGVVKGPGGTSTYTSEVVYERGKWLLKRTTFVEN